MGIDWLSNCQINNESFLSCEQQWFINQYIGIIYGVGFIVIVLVITAIAYAVLHSKKKKMSNDDKNL